MSENNVNITDDELDLIMVALATTLQGWNKYVEVNGEDKVSLPDINTMKEIIKLHNKLEHKYY